MIFLGIALIIIIFIYGIYVMNKVDLFLSEENLEEINTTDILIYGCNEISVRVKTYLDSINVKYDLVDSNMVKGIDEKYRILLMLSSDDLDNLTVYSLGKKWGRIRTAIAVCNNVENKRIYDEYGIMNVDFKYGHSDQFLLMIKEKIEND